MDYLLGGAGHDYFELRNPPTLTDVNPFGNDTFDGSMLLLKAKV